MSRALDYLTAHWLPALFLGVALVPAARAVLRRRETRAVPPAVLAGALVLMGAGALSLPAGWAWGLVLAAGALLFGLLLVLVLSGAWWAPPGYLVAVLGLLGAGGLWLQPAGDALAEALHGLRGLEFVQPWWLLLLLLVPLIVLMSLRRLNREEIRPWIAVLLRSALVVLLTLALAEPRLRQPNENVTVLFVVDRSQSVPEEFGDDPRRPGVKTDLRALRVRDFIDNSVEEWGKRHSRDRAGLIVFGRRPRLELPPSDAPRFNLKELPPAVDGNYTDIAAALKLAFASFPEGTAKRVVLISDGNENLGSAEEQGRLARTLGVQIDVVPLAARQKNEDEVLVERVDAPALIEQGSQVPIRVLVRSHNPNVVVGRLTLKQITAEGEEKLVGEYAEAPLRFGLNSFSFTRPLTNEQRSYTYEAEFEPARVEDEKGRVLRRRPRPGEQLDEDRGVVRDPLPGDRVQNNRSSTHVVARGRRRILLLEGRAGDHKFLADKLLEAGNGKFKVLRREAAALDRYRDRDQLAVFLSNFDCVLLANVAADQMSEEQQEVFRSNTHDQGCGLVMIGGPDGYGAGGWQNTPVEKALPVDADIRSLKVQGKGGLVLVMHASEMADGNLWQKRIARLAVERLAPADEVGVIVFGLNGHQWHVPLQEIGADRSKILGAIDKLLPGDMPDFDPALRMAHQALTDPKKGIATRHVIVISDGDPQQSDRGLLKKMRQDKVSVTAVGVATHGPAQDVNLQGLVVRPGKYYSARDPRQLPAIYIKESRLVSQSFVHEKPFRPRLAFRSGPTDRLPDPLPPLGGFVRTTPKASPLVEVPILTPRFADQDFPLLAYWHYGLGKAVAFTSDAGNPRFWSRAWAEGGGGRDAVFARFWEQIVDWSLRPVESRRLALTTEYRDGKVRITVDARTDDNKPDIHLRLRGGLTTPEGKGGAGGQKGLRFVQKNSGVYEVEVKAEEAGSYFITAQATRVQKVVGRDGKEHEVEEGVDSVRSGVTLPYSPEFAELESNTALLQRLREMTEGKSYADDAQALDEAARSGVVFRPGPGRVRSLLPLWYWLLFVTCVLLPFDVAVRRIAVDPRRAAAVVANVWARLRGQPVREGPPAEFLERLQARKARVGESLAGSRPAQRFEGGPAPAGAPPGAGAAAPVPPPAAGPRPPAPPAAGEPQPEAEAGDFADRLLRAKKKVWEERKKEGP